MPDARLYRTSPFSIFSSRAEIRTSFRSTFRPIWTISSAGISRGVRPMSSSPAYRSFRFTRTNWTSIAVKPRLWMSSIPSRRVRPLQDSGMPEGPKRITRSPNGEWPPLDYYSVRPDISTFAALDAASGGRRRPAGPVPHETPPRGRRSLRVSPDPRKAAPPGGDHPKGLVSQGFLGRTQAPFIAQPSQTEPHLHRVV